MATKRSQVFKCEHCGQIVEVLHGDGPIPKCCGDSMNILTENTVDAAKEKHVPVVEKIEGGFKVAVGSVAHPMIQAHYIEWIELVVDNKSYKQFLEPEKAPEAVFMIDADQATARAYCNLHGFWKS